MKSKELSFIVYKGLLFIATATTFCLSTGCSDRERLNPIDPLNPKTGGKPVGLFAVSMRDTVKLGWQSLGLRDLAGYRIYRRSSFSSNFTLIDSVAGNQHSYREFGLTLGWHYIYQITAFTPVSESSPSDTVGITPGPAYTWIADAGIGMIFKYTHDGAHELSRHRGFIRPERLQANPKTGELWVIDTVTRELRRLNADGSNASLRITLQNPIDLVVDSTANSVWVADASGSLVKYDERGARVAEAFVQGVSAIAFDYSTHELWALSRKHKQLLRIDSNNQVNLESTALISPQAIDIHRGSGDLWIADSTRIIVRRGSGDFEEASGYAFSYATRVAVNQGSGECWAIDSALRLPPSRIVKFDVSAVAQFAVDGFYAPRNMSVNVFDGSCFVTEPQLSSIVHVSASGHIINRANNFSRPFDVDVENRPLN